MNRVYPALPYAPHCLGSLDRTAYMYLRQYQFPDTFDGQLDKHMTADSDRIFFLGLSPRSQMLPAVHGNWRARSRILDQVNHRREGNGIS